MMYLPCFLMAQPFYVPGGAVAGQRMKGVIHSMEGVPEGEISYTGHVGQRPKSPPEPPPPPASLQPVFSINPHPISTLNPISTAWQSLHSSISWKSSNSWCWLLAWCWLLTRCPLSYAPAPPLCSALADILSACAQTVFRGARGQHSKAR